MSLDICLKDSITMEYVDFSENLNITHNLNKVAEYLGFYYVLWHPHLIPEFASFEDIAWKDILPHLYKAFYEVSINGYKADHLLPSNGYGTMNNLVRFITNYIKVCLEHPTALIRVST